MTHNQFIVAINELGQSIWYDNLSLDVLQSGELKRLLKIRRQQPAFHPNATQFTLQLPAPYFAFWRQSMDRTQSIFAVHNMTAESQELRLAELNLICLDAWEDLISGQSFHDQYATIPVAPYQCLWITNRHQGIAP